MLAMFWYITKYTFWQMKYWNVITMIHIHKINYKKDSRDSFPFTSDDLGESLSLAQAGYGGM